MKTSSFFVAASFVALSIAGCAAPPAQDEGVKSQESHETAADATAVDPIDASFYGTYESETGQIAKLTLTRSDPVKYVRLDRVDPTCTGASCETREYRGAWGLAHDVESGMKVIQFYDLDFGLMDDFAYEVTSYGLRLVRDRENTRLVRQPAEPKLVTDPIDGSLYGSYHSESGRIAKLTLRLSDPVVYSRTDRVDPACTGDACETRERTGVWDLAHYEGSLTKVIRFFDSDFNEVDELAYEVEGSELRLVYDGEASRLFRDP